MLGALGSMARRARRLPPRDPRQTRLLTIASLRWVLAHRAWTWWYLRCYLRLLRLRLRRPDIVVEGMVFLGRRVEIEVRRGYGRLILGRWVHLGDQTRLRVHEGTMRVGDKCVFGRDSTLNCYLDVEIGAATLVGDWVYLCDFDHVHADVEVPIKDQGIVKAPVRIGPDVWIGTKVTVLRGTTVGTGCVLAAHTVARGDYPARSVVAGVPGRVVRRRGAADEVTADGVTADGVAAGGVAAGGVTAGGVVVNGVAAAGVDPAEASLTIGPPIRTAMRRRSR